MESSNTVHPLTSAMEDYLEAIYHLETERRIARVRDIANRLGVKMSSGSVSPPPGAETSTTKPKLLKPALTSL